MDIENRTDGTATLCLDLPLTRPKLGSPLAEPIEPSLALTWFGS